MCPDAKKRLGLDLQHIKKKYTYTANLLKKRKTYCTEKRQKREFIEFVKYVNTFKNIFDCNIKQLNIFKPELLNT